MTLPATFPDQGKEEKCQKHMEENGEVKMTQSIPPIANARFHKVCVSSHAMTLRVWVCVHFRNGKPRGLLFPDLGYTIWVWQFGTILQN